jgi:TetR/AcrR family transcriptional regulator, mexJK operon transcriptional repressor
MDELCLVCGISKPTLYYYFQNKENLFVMVLQYRLRGFHQVIAQSGSLAERLSGIAANILDSFQTEYTVMLRDREHIKTPENLERIRRAFYEELFEPLIALMQTGVDSGELESADAHFLSLIFLGSINNFIGRSEEMGSDSWVLAGRLSDYFLNGARKRA